jgi:hypothetical protein
MGKRSDFERIERDFYPTPSAPIHALTPWLGFVDGFCEPCVGAGALADVLVGLGHRLVLATDPEATGPASDYALPLSYAEIEESDCRNFSHFITNPPWPAARGRGEPTLSLIRHLANLRPTWLLLSADFAHNAYAAEVMAYCLMIVAVGRVKWIEDSEHVGKDNVAWYLFDRHALRRPTIFIPRRKVRVTYAHDIERML